MESIQKPAILLGTVVSNNPVSDSMFLIEIELEQKARFSPGQFCMVNWQESPATLGRPLSILDCTENRLKLLYKSVGEGTRRLAASKPGCVLQLLTPLGNCFQSPVSDLPHILIAGGVGLPPMLSWAKKYARPQDILFFGGRNGADIPWSLLSEKWLVSVDEKLNVPAGKRVFHGNIIQMFFAQKFVGKAVVLSCGPTPLLQVVKKISTDKQWDCFVSVEERMGCGYGVCRGCVIPTVSDSYQTVCNDGPVFNAYTIKLGDEL